jgi:hypothetical protein
MPLGRGRRIAALGLLAMGAGASCAGHIAKKAGEGAVQGLKTSNPDEQPMRVAGRRVVAGALESMDEPEQERRMKEVLDRAVYAAVEDTLLVLNDPAQQQRIRDLVTTVVDETTATAFRNLGGPEGGGDGPAAMLAAQIAQAATRQAMREMLGGVGTGLEQVFPGCAAAGDGEECRRQRIRALTREAGAGFSSGVLDTLRVPLLIATGLLGLIVGLVAHWLWSLRPRPPRGGHAPLRSIAESRVP